MADRFVVLVRKRSCGCRVRLDQVEGTGPNVPPATFELELCPSHQRYALFIATAETRDFTVEINRRLQP